MFIKSVSALAVLAFAAHASASEAMPYKPLMKMSVHEMFGLGRRDDNGYQPTQSVCGTGNTCAEACGDGYETCTSSDSMVHCFNKAAAQTCCPDATGNSCDAGYYCTADTKGETWCCPNALDVAACAAAFKVTGGLTSEKPTPTTTATPTSTYVPTTATPSSTYTPNNTTSVETSTYPAASASYPPSNSTNPSYTATTSPTATQVVSGVGINGPAGVMAVILAAGAAALL